MTNNEIIDIWINEQRFRGNSEKSITYYIGCLDKFETFNKRNFDEITKNDLKQFVLWLRSNNINSVSVQTYFRGVKVFFNYLYNENIISDNIVENLKIPKAKRNVIQILDNDEIDKLLNSVSGKKLIIVLLMLDCGLRSSEVCALKKTDVKDNYIIVSGKGNKQRIVPVSGYTKSYLNSYSSGTEALISGCTNNSIKMMFQKLKKTTGIERLHAHLLRHTFATYYLINGGDVISLQEILGHTSLEMVKRYSHLANYHLIAKGLNYSPFSKNPPNK